MKITVRIAVYCLLTFFVFTVAAHAQVVAASKDLPNLYKVNTGLYRGGQPTEAGIKQIKALGIKTVIDLRDDDGPAETRTRRSTTPVTRPMTTPVKLSTMSRQSASRLSGPTRY